MMTNARYVAVVYQCGIANVFATQAGDPGNMLDPKDRKMTRVYQGDFRTAEAILRGAMLAGAFGRVFHCDLAGDISGQPWLYGPGDLFAEGKANAGLDGLSVVL